MPPPPEGFASRFLLGPALRTQPDRRLVTLVREGYETAFEEIVRRYGRQLTRYAAGIVGGRSEDVAQDAFSKALLALRRSDAEIELRPWLFRIVRNAALNDLRDRPPAPEALAEAVAGGRNPAEEVERRAELTDLIERLQALPEPQRAAIVMRELEGLSHEEIAAALGVTGGAARQAIHRARRALRNGAGMLVPLPLLKALLAGPGTSAAEAAAGMAGVGSAAGAGVALKATAATVLVAGAVGAGVVLDHQSPRDGGKAMPSREASVRSGGLSPVPATAVSGRGGDGRSGGGSDEDRGGSGSDDRSRHGRGEPEPGDDRGREESAGGDDRSGPVRSGDERSGQGGDSLDGGDSSSSGRDGGSSGPGSGDGSGSSGSGASGSGKGSGTSGSGEGTGGGSGTSGSSSGSGSGGESAAVTESDAGGGSGSSGSGDLGSGASGSGGSGSESSSGSGSGEGSGTDSSGSSGDSAELSP